MIWAERGDYVVRRDEEVEGVYFLLQGQVPFFFCVFGKYYIFQKGLVWLNSVFFVSLYVFAGSGCGISRRSRLLLLLGVRFETIWFLRPWYFWECLLSRCCCCLTTGLLFSLLFSSFFILCLLLTSSSSCLFFCSWHASCSCLIILLCLTPTLSLIQIRNNNPVL